MPSALPPAPAASQPTLVLITHLHPLGGSSGQHQRVFYMLKALSQYFSVHVVLGTYSQQEARQYRQQMAQQFAGVEAHVLVRRYTWWVRLRGWLYEYVPGYRTTNYTLPRLFTLPALQALLPWRQVQYVLFEYWHSYQVAVRLKQLYPRLLTLCDTHNILSGNFGFYLQKNWLKRRLARRLQAGYEHLEYQQALPAFDGLIGINLEEAAIYRQRYPQKPVWYLPMGIDLSSFERLPPPAPGSPFTVLYYGSLGSARNQRDCLWLYEQVVLPLYQEGHDIRLRIVGGNAPAGFEARFNPACTQWVGFANQLAPAFTGVHLAIIPWQGRFGFRSRLIEIMAHGIPVLTSTDAVWGMGLQHEVHLLAVENIYTAAMELVQQFYKHPAQLAPLAEAGYWVVQHQFSYVHTYQTWAQGLAQQGLASTVA